MENKAGVEFIVGYETKKRLKSITEKEMKQYASKDCRHCYGIGRYGYGLPTQKGRKIYVCNCVEKNIKALIRKGL